MSTYIGVVDKGRFGFGVWFPDLPGCTSGGSTMEQLRAFAVEAVQMWTECTIERGGSIPRQRTVAELRANADVMDDVSACAGVFTDFQVP